MVQGTNSDRIKDATNLKSLQITDVILIPPIKAIPFSSISTSAATQDAQSLSRTNYDTQTVTNNANSDTPPTSSVHEAEHSDSLPEDASLDEDKKEKIGMSIPYEDQYASKRWPSSAYHAYNNLNMSYKYFMVVVDLEIRQNLN